MSDSAAIASFRTQLEAFCTVLCGGILDHGYDPSCTSLPPSAQISANLKLTVEHLSRVLYSNSSTKPSRSSTNEGRFRYLVHRFTCNRKVYKTSDGTFGLSASSTKTGDIAVALLGLKEAMELRSTGRGTYQVVEESYCHGYMTGEAFLGPLPNMHRIVWYVDQRSHGVYPAYLDIQSGSSSPEDPRLSDLPEGWKVVEHERKDVDQLFENTETGEQTWNDPRLTPEALEARGVKIEYFDLV